MDVLLIIFSGFVVGLLAPWVDRAARGWGGWLFSLVPLLGAVLLARYIPDIAAGETVRVGWAWVPGLEVELAFLVDGLSLIFGLLVCGIGVLIFIYSGSYMHEHQHRGRFFAFMLMFMASMLGLVLADNIFSLYIFFELTSLFSFFLIGIDGHAASSRRSARQAVLVTNAGGLGLLAGMLLMGQVSGTYSISELLASGRMGEHPLYLATLLLVLFGAFTKSAQAPFHFWLPNAMEAPTPVSAYLHSATMVKAGIYLVARFSPVLAGTVTWQVVVGGIGGLTMLLSAWVALRHTDMKRILAYSTVMALGLIIMLLGIGTDAAVTAALLYVIVHGLYKAALFMVAGTVDHATHSRDVTRLGGLRKALPFTFAGALVAALSMAGLPIVIGFVGKELAYLSLISAGPGIYVLAVAAVLANIAMVAVACILVIRPFLGATTPKTEHAHGASPALWLGPVLLGIASLVFGAMPGLLEKSVLLAATGAVLGEASHVHLALWHGLTFELGMSVVTVLGGVAVYTLWNRLRDSAPLDLFSRVVGDGPDRGFERLLKGLGSLAVWQTRLLQNGRLSTYLATIVAATVVLIGGVFLRGVEINWQPYPLASVAFPEWVLIGVIVAASIFLLTMKSRVATIVVLSSIAYCIALLFLYFGAPDLAITQLLVETLMAVLVVLAFFHLPTMHVYETRGDKLRNALLAIGMGSMVTLLMLGMLSQPFDTTIGEWYAQNSYLKAHGRNIVNVILVDFRAIDTLGEITVICVAGVSIAALLWRRQVNRQSPQQAADAEEKPHD